MNNATFNVEYLPPVLPDKKVLFDSSVWIIEKGKKVVLANIRYILSIEQNYKKKVKY